GAARPRRAAGGSPAERVAPAARRRLVPVAGRHPSPADHSVAGRRTRQGTLRRGSRGDPRDPEGGDREAAPDRFPVACLATGELSIYPAFWPESSARASSISFLSSSIPAKAWRTSAVFCAFSSLPRSLLMCPRPRLKLKVERM